MDAVYHQDGATLV